MLIGEFNVFDRSATIADEMKMPVSGSFVHIEGTPKSEAIGHPLIYEYIEIAVHVSQTERRKLTPKLIIDPVGGHMDVPRLQ